MTTIFRLVVVEDLAAPNDVYLIPDVKGCTVCGAAHLSLNLSKIDSTAAGVAFFSEKVSAQLPDFCHVLLVGHSAIQPINRITSYRGIYRFMKYIKLAIPSGEIMPETHLEFDGGVKFFGAIILDNVNSGEISTFLRNMDLSAVLVAIRRASAQNKIKEILCKGWEKARPLPKEIIKLACEDVAIAYFPIGWFDDIEPGCAIIANKPLMRILLTGI